MTKVFILILNYNRHQDTTKCIRALKKSNLPENTQIIIIDNSTTNHSQKILSQTFPKIKLIKTPKNNGFAYGNNFGIRYALKNKASHIMIINPDVTVGKSFLKPLLNLFKTKPQAGLVAPAHQHQQNKQTFFGLGGKINWQTTKCEHINTKKLALKKSKNYEFVSFACVLIKREVFEKIGLLNELYFMYLEDVDYCLTAGKADFKCYIEPSVKIKHNTSSSFNIPTQKLKFSFVSQFKFINRWLKFPQNIYAYVYMTFFYAYLYILWTYHYHKNK
ncbi:glycosyltransferase family 2 protein [Patescibacteria group bacterium]|nr:glycosyltransferase family 2 protein [Patescibacteria group bacterium]